MDSKEWTQMLDYQKELHYFMRAMLMKKKDQVLTNSELELLALVYRVPDSCTPLFLSQHTGMKKEAVSRTLRQLFEKGWLDKQPNPQDERSYTLLLTEEGRAALEKSYETMLKPFYELRCRMGPDFAEFFRLLSKFNQLLNTK